MSVDLVERLKSAAGWFNEVVVLVDPNGDLVIGMTHSAADDDAAFVRVKPEDIIFLYGAGRDTPRFDRVNRGGTWDE